VNTQIQRLFPGINRLAMRGEQFPDLVEFQLAER